MEIFIERQSETIERAFSGTAAQLLADLNVNPQTVLVVCDGQLITEDEDVSSAERIELLTVVSGG